jgi:molybdopterin synthase sulfur carrier subunit
VPRWFVAGPTVRQDEVVVTVRYFAAARAAAGVAEESTPAATLGELLTHLSRRGDRLAAVLGAASFLVDGVAWRDRHAPLPPRCTVDVLPPFAGG